jgi:hypothetical protein
MNIVSRQYAIANNLPRYFTGELCVNGHIEERYTQKTTCVECERIRKKRAREKRKELVKKTGINKYFSGEPCAKGHIAERYVVNNRCVECHKLERKRNSTPLTYEQKEEAKRLRKEATIVRKEKKAAEQKALLLTDEEKKIVSYARHCIQGLYPYNHGGYGISKPIAEFECGFSSEELIDYLSDASNVRTRWGTYKNNNYWHVDHKIPLSKLVKEGVTEIWNLNALDNLKLIRATKNLKKGAKVSQKKLNDYIESKYQQNHFRLGLYNPSERENIIYDKVMDRIYNNLILSISNTAFSLAKSESAIRDDIQKDFENGQTISVWTHRQKPNLNEIKKYLMGHMYYFAYRTNDFCKVTSMLLASYSPLQKYKRMHFEQFKYKEDCESYYQGLIRNESDELCIEYLKVVSSNNCKNCKPKGFFKMLSEI